MTTTMTQEKLTSMTPEKASEMLMEGNARFVARRMNRRDLLQQVYETTEAQHPYAVVLGCIDSRVPLETIFDAGIGDIFGIRIAGNIVNEDILGSMEFACEVIGSKLILVLGHTSCGAVKGAYDQVELGHLTGLVSKIQPAVEAVFKSGRTGEESLDEIARKNVELTVKAIKGRSPILAKLAERGQIAIAGGMYDVASGQVTLV